LAFLIVLKERMLLLVALVMWSTLHDDQRARIVPLIPGGSEGKRGHGTDNPRFINALLWMARLEEVGRDATTA
jgi:hypothetical protein